MLLADARREDRFVRTLREVWGLYWRHRATFSSVIKHLLEVAKLNRLMY